MATTIEFVGVYDVESTAGCYLIELRIHDSQERFDFAKFTQPIAAEPIENWQVPWLECLLNESGSAVVADDREMQELAANHWRGTMRIAFYFHQLDLKKPLATPFGEFALPPIAPLPARLTFLSYEPP